MTPTRLTEWHHDGLTFDVRDSGPLDGLSVLCLHGFPQDGTAYDEVARRLAASGHRVLAPDQRGYSAGARPAGREQYGLRHLARDAVALLDAAGVDRAVVVGHDWGGAVAWALASRYAERVGALVALSTPHPAALRKVAFASSQALRSSYMALFQLPFLPEALLTGAGGRALELGLRRSGLPAGVARHYAARLREPGAATAALDWYRAAARGERWGPGRVAVPTTYMVGRSDPFFSSAAVRRTAGLVAGHYRVVELDAGHWLPEQQPGAVADAVQAASRAGGRTVAAGSLRAGGGVGQVARRAGC